MGQSERRVRVRIRRGRRWRKLRPWVLFGGVAVGAFVGAYSIIALLAPAPAGQAPPAAPGRDAGAASRSPISIFGED